MPSTYHKEAFERIAPARRQKLLSTAITEFANKGYETANINVIASKAGISVGSVYKYFSAKEDLFLTCVNHGIALLEQVLQGVLQSEGPLLEKVERVIRAIQQYSRENQDYIKLYNEITSEGKGELVWKLAKNMETVSASLYSSLIAQAQKEGAVRKDFDPRAFAFFLDNLFMTLQFSYACDYYRERFKIYVGEDVLEQDDFVVEQALKFIQHAFD